jgi:hypothetical protein
MKIVVQDKDHPPKNIKKCVFHENKLHHKAPVFQRKQNNYQPPLLRCKKIFCGIKNKYLLLQRFFDKSILRVKTGFL